MPRIHDNEPMPDWCELRAYTIASLAPGASVRFDATDHPKDIVIVGRGSVGHSSESVAERDVIVPISYPAEFTAGPNGATVIRMVGRWGEDYGGLGIFGVREVESPRDPGDVVTYPKKTAFDAHYHDCDEYWIVFEGHGVAVSEGRSWDVGPGDCIATGMGHHHDFPEATSPVRAVFFETTMEGEKRRGHLWEHTHGSAQPHPDRA